MTNNFRSIAIDGPAASGKSVVGKKLSELINYEFLDTGIMYRAVTYVSKTESIDPILVSNYFKEKIIEVIFEDKNNKIYYKKNEITNSLFSDLVDTNVSEISKIIEVRKNLVIEQRKISESNSIVMVGRDIGTIVLPKSELKVYLDASIAVRAKRRSEELGLDSSDIEKKLKSRDITDSSRKNSPLRIDEDAHLINTDNLNIDQVVMMIKDLIPND